MFSFFKEFAVDGWDSGFGWKKNWVETRQHFIDWWDRRGLVVCSWGARVPAAAPHAPLGEEPQLAGSSDEAKLRRSHEDIEWRAQYTRWRLAQADCGADIMPLATMDIGPGSLALALGSLPGFSPFTVWFEPAWKPIADARDIPPVRFNAGAHWWKIHELQARANVRLAQGAYLTGMPDLVENVDIVSALRDPQLLMMDMVENPEWVEQAVMDVNRAWFEAFDRLHDIIKGPDNGNAWGAFCIWGPGKTAKVQCDACAMFSPAMFNRFVAPALTEQCEWLDYSMYHLDGTQCECHLDALLKIDALDAVEWTPQDGVEPGWHERWHPMYKRILDAGKSLQVVDVTVDTMEYVLKAIGGRGVYLMANLKTRDEVERAARIADRWR
jgi:hypothetical protein